MKKYHLLLILLVFSICLPVAMGQSEFYETEIFRWLNVNGTLNISNDVDITQGNLTLNSNSILEVDYMDLIERQTNPPDPLANETRIYAKAQNGRTLVEIVDSAGIRRTLGHDAMMIVRNADTIDLNKGDIVYISGSTGNIAEVQRAIANDTSKTPARGMIIESISTNDFGYMAHRRSVQGLDTSAYNEGDELWLSPNELGNLTTTQPTHPDLAQKIGIVTDSNPSQGVIHVDIDQNVEHRESGTIEDTFKIGKGSGTKTLQFTGNSGNEGTINWTGNFEFFGGNLNITNNSILDIQKVNFISNTGLTLNEGDLYYDSEHTAFHGELDQPTVDLDFGHTLLIRAKNIEGRQINRSEVVYVSGSTGDNPEVQLARADNLSTARLIGVVAQDSISNNGVGYLAINGRLRNIDTSAFSAGDILYLSPTIAGAFTAIKPTQPDKSARIGVVVRSSVNEGSILVTPNREIDNFDPNSIIFADNKGELSQNNSALNWNNSKSELFVGGNISAENYLNGSGALEWIRPEHIADVDYGDICSGDTCPFAWNISSSKVFQQDLDWRVGAGTNNPVATLHANIDGAGDVFKTTREATSAYLTIDHGSALTNFDSDSHYTFSISGTEIMRINSNERVGINTNSPLGKFHVADSGNPQITLEDTSGNNQIRHRFTASALDWVMGIHGGANAFKIQNDTAFGSGGLFVLEDDGDLGLGVTPSEALHVTGSGLFENGNIRTQAGDDIPNPAIGFENSSGANIWSFQYLTTSDDSFSIKDIQANQEVVDIEKGHTSKAVNYLTSGPIFNPVGTANNFTIESDNDANMFFVDSPDDRIGIGTTSPGATLDVDGTMELGNPYNSDPSAQGSSEGSFAFGGSTSEIFYNESEANNGVIHYNVAGGGNAQFRLGSNFDFRASSNIYLSSGASNLVTLRALGGGESLQLDGGANTITLNTADTNVNSNLFVGSDTGLGFSNPSHKLHVNGTVRFNDPSQNNGWIEFDAKSANSPRIQFQTLEMYRGGSGGLIIEEGTGGSGGHLIVKGNIRIDGQDNRLQFGNGVRRVEWATAYSTTDTEVRVKNTGTKDTIMKILGGLTVGTGYNSTIPPSQGAIIEGNVSIGKPAPTDTLDVNGSIRVGYSNNANPGAIRWNSTNNKHQGYNGSDWINLY